MARSTPRDSRVGLWTTAMYHAPDSSRQPLSEIGRRQLELLKALRMLPTAAFTKMPVKVEPAFISCFDRQPSPANTRTDPRVWNDTGAHIDF